jgi:hypothetical protein
VHVSFAITDDDIAGHSREFQCAAGSDQALTRMLKAAEALAGVGYRYCTDGAFRASVNAAFKSST